MIKKIARNLQKKYLKFKGLKFGTNFRITGSPKFGSEPYLIEIGNDVTVTNGVIFITHDGAKVVSDRLMNSKTKSRIKFGRIKLGNNVFVGVNSIILPNVSIGDNSIIAAGSTVTKSFESNSVLAGNPARKIMSIQEYHDKNSWMQKLSDRDLIELRKNKRLFLVKNIKDDN